MKYVIAALLATFLLSASDLCGSYALQRGLANIRHCFLSHGIVYTFALALGIWLVSKKGEFSTNISFPEDRIVGCASILSGVFAFAALLMINYSFQNSQNIGYTVGLISSTALFTLLLEASILKKPMQSRGTIGLFVILIGVWLISGCANDR